MFKKRYIPQYLLAILLLILIFLEGWTYYLGKADVTFKRLLKNEPYQSIKSLSLRRYKEGAISPHLFTIKTDKEDSVIKSLKRDCNLKKIDISSIPTVAKRVDSEMVDVIKKSPFIYLSKTYDLNDPKVGRMCLVFRDKENIYLFINGNLK